ncbi:MAG TPA: PEGA domain-containing protein [Nannocystis exedens]|nr:PEGA domain-containing protein [Nannocystis exedens]
MFKLPRAEPKPPGYEAKLDEPYADNTTGEHSGEAIPGPQDIHVGTFGRPDPSGSMATPATSGTSQSLVAAAAAAAAAAQAGSTTGPLGANPLAAQAPPTGQHPTMGNPMMSPMATTYPPGAFPPLDKQPERSRNGVLILGFVALGVVAVLGYFAVTNRGDVQSDTPKVADDSEARLQSLLSRAEKNIDRKQYSQAEILLDSSLESFARYPDLMEQVAAQKDRIEIGRLLDSGRNYEQAGQKAEALKAYREILSRRSDHAEARERIAALVGGSADAALGWLTASSSPVGGAVYVDDQDAPLGLTPLTAQPLAAGPHQISIRRDGFLPWKKSVTIEANKTFPINAELTQKRGTRRPPRQATPDPNSVKSKPPAKKKKKATKPTKPTTKKKNNGLLPVGP